VLVSHYACVRMCVWIGLIQGCHISGFGAETLEIEFISGLWSNSECLSISVQLQVTMSKSEHICATQSKII